MVISFGETIMSKNIEINYKNDSSTYETLYPKSIATNITMPDSNITIDQAIENHRTDDTFEVGDIICTTRPNMSEKWLECKGGYIKKEDYPDLTFLPSYYYGVSEEQSIDYILSQGVIETNGVLFSRIGTKMVYSIDKENWNELIDTGSEKVAWAKYIDKYNCYFVQTYLFIKNYPHLTLYKISTNFSIIQTLKMDQSAPFLQSNDTLKNIALMDYSEDEDLFIGEYRYYRSGIKENGLKISPEDFSVVQIGPSITTSSIYFPVYVYCSHGNQTYPYILYMSDDDGGSQIYMFGDSNFRLANIGLQNDTDTKTNLIKIKDYFISTESNSYCSIYSDIDTESNNWKKLDMSTSITGIREDLINIISYYNSDDGVWIYVNKSGAALRGVYYKSDENSPYSKLLNYNVNYTIIGISFEDNIEKSITYATQSGNYKIVKYYSSNLLPYMNSNSSNNSKEKYYIKATL